MQLSGRERKLLIALGVVVLVTVLYLAFLRPGGDDEVTIPDLFPSPTVSTVVGGNGDGATPVASPSATPTAFVVPADARDPFGG